MVTTHYMEEAAECGRLVIMADGRVVAEGTVAEIVGDARVTVVQAASWARAFGALEESGFQVSLASRTLRVPGAPPEEVRRALGDGAAAQVFAAPATLDERFFELTRPAVPRRVPLTPRRADRTGTGHRSGRRAGKAAPGKRS